jgi:aspartyl-tRNA(Asn)/glutamyl-tRNA(Gln) amidotransferase subunit C
MKIDVEHVARLARLGLNEEEKKTYGEQLSRILGHAELLQKLNTDQVEPTTHSLPLKNVLREDKAIPFEDTEAIVNCAPKEESNMFSVPRIVE